MNVLSPGPTIRTTFVVTNFYFMGNIASMIADAETREANELAEQISSRARELAEEVRSGAIENVRARRIDKAQIDKQSAGGSVEDAHRISWMLARLNGDRARFARLTGSRETQEAQEHEHGMMMEGRRDK